ncbi:MAG: radical SAM protein [Desulfobacterales bacterium]|jgi:radical SAM superfamily enzyme YgiQ (UPF0313 family)
MPTGDTPHILLINPWIHDFAAYDFWAKPMGLLAVASMLRHHGIQVSYIDCLDRFHPRAPQTDPGARYGRGPYHKTRIPKPAGLHDVPRNFSRYGIKPQWFNEDLLKQGRPDLVMVTSLMTYWYPGVQETIGVIRAVFPQTPVVLGGIYARLCADHASKNAGADHVANGSTEKDVLSLVQKFTGYSATPAFDSEHLDEYPYPAFDLQTRPNYVPILTSKGCPFHCAYCASGFLEPKRLLRDPEAVVEEIAYWKKAYDIDDFILYDDAFLVDAERHAVPILEGILRTGLKVRFHTPNALHIRGINPRAARLMFAAGFTTLRLGLETTRFDHREEIDLKVSEHEFVDAINCLKKAGFEKSQVGAYLLVGLPDQKFAAVKHSIEIVRQIGITPIAAYYTPIPHTALWPKAVAASRYDIESDPIYTNNAVTPCRKQPFSWHAISELKELINS